MAKRSDNTFLIRSKTSRSCVVLCLLFSHTSCSTEKDEEGQRVNTFAAESDRNSEQATEPSRWSMDQSTLTDDEKNMVKALQNGGTLNVVIYSKNSPTAGLITLSEVEFAPPQASLALEGSGVRAPEFLILPMSSDPFFALADAGSKISIQQPKNELTDTAVAGGVVTFYDRTKMNVVTNSVNGTLSFCDIAVQEKETECAMVASRKSTQTAKRSRMLIDKILCQVTKSDTAAALTTKALAGSVNCFPATNSAGRAAESSAQQRASDLESLINHEDGLRDTACLVGVRGIRKVDRSCHRANDSCDFEQKLLAWPGSTADDSCL
jgi:hypothetical protein